MSKIMANLSTLNSFVRTLLAVVFVGGVGTTVWYGYSTYHAAELELQRQKSALSDARQLLGEKQDQIDRLETSLQLLKVDYRIARLEVVDQLVDPDSGKVASHLEFVELSEQGEPIDEPKAITVLGDVVYLDNWVVKFEDRFIEQADIDRSTSLVLFRRIFGEYQQPSEGAALDRVGSQPRAYARGGAPSGFEKKIWADFWSIANDPEKAKKLGIRAAHGEAVSIKVEKGKAYKILLRASDGLSIVPDGDIQTANRLVKPAS